MTHAEGGRHGGSSSSTFVSCRPPGHCLRSSDLRQFRSELPDHWAVQLKPTHPSSPFASDAVSCSDEKH